MKKAIISAALVAAIGAGGYMGFRANSSQSNQLSDVMLANIEALAEDESAGSNCHYTNGYSRWKTERPWFWTDEETFYDCCANLRRGYSPEGSCI